MTTQTVTPPRGQPALQDVRLGRLDALYALLCLLALLPPLLFRYPESVDYVNHLMRVELLAAPAGSLSHSYFVPHWRPIANLGLDLLTWPLARAFSPEIAMKLVWLLCMAGFATGAWYLHRAVYKTTQPAFVMMALCLFNLPLTMGFLNFSLGVACMLFGFGLWLRHEDRMAARTMLAFNLLAFTAMLCHVAAAGALGLTILMHELLRGRHDLWKRGAQLAACFLLPAAWFLVVAFSHPIISKVGQPQSIRFDANQKLLILLAPFLTGQPSVNVLIVTLLWLTAFGLMWRQRRNMRKGLGLILLWWVIVLAVPSDIGDAGFIAPRLALFPLVLTFCLISGLPPGATQRGAGERRLLPTAACILLPLSLLALIPAWRGFNEDVTTFRAMEPQIPLHAKILVSRAPRRLVRLCGGSGSLAHFDNGLATLAVIDRGAFVNVFFADPNLQPVTPRPQWQALYKPNAPPLRFELLMAHNSAIAGAAAAPLAPRYLGFFPDDWSRDYDILAVERPRCGAMPDVPANLALIARSRSYLLYAIRHRAEMLSAAPRAGRGAPDPLAAR